VKIILFNISKFCLLDEPFSGLSPINIEKISNLITDNSKRKGIIISDHNYRQILKISSKVVLLKNGKTNSIKNFNELVEHNYILNL
jgi:ABC-type lipopolysaccharide export system ATPase subunit